jgi:hypothetical protein
MDVISKVIVTKNTSYQHVTNAKRNEEKNATSNIISGMRSLTNFF